MKKYYIAVGVVALLVVGYVLGYTTKPVADAPVFAGAVGDTQSTPKMSQVQGNGNGTYITANNTYQYGSVCNSTASDWVVEQAEYVFDSLTTTSTSTAIVILKAATSSSATAAIGTNYVLNTTVSTATPMLYTASTTPGDTASAFKRIVGSGKCLNFEANATTSSNVWLKVLYLSK